MSKKRFWWSVFAVWFVMMVTNWFFHDVWLVSWYQQTSQFWRSTEEIQGMLPLMAFGTFIFSWAFVWIYSKGISNDNPWTQAFRYALAILLVAKVPDQIETWIVSPYPAELVLRWGFVSLVQAFACAYVMTWTFKPVPNWTKATHH